MLAITMGSSAAAAPRITAGANTVAAAVVFRNALRVVFMALIPVLWCEEK